MSPGLSADIELIFRLGNIAVPALGCARDATQIQNTRDMQPLVVNSKPVSLPNLASRF